MKIIEIKFTKKFGGAWYAFEAVGVEPAFTGPSGKQQAIDYARNCRFGGPSGGEIHVYDDAGEKVRRGHCCARLSGIWCLADLDLFAFQ